ncbi:MAG: Ni/Fe hydrogenase subunit alpha [bacterium]|nr:Ni/Fe hydrogenase subunit alpha [bacterium]
MYQEIVIDPITRIEGHSKITLQLDEQGVVQNAMFHVTQFRGFEKFSEGRPFYEMPSLMARTCGICPVSHLLASAKACDKLLAVQIPQTAIKLRQVMNLAQILQSHALNFFYLSAPDFLLGMDSDPVKRNLIGVAQNDPKFARDGIRLRQIGQMVIEIMGGKRIHPTWIVPGGVNSPLTEEKREKILQMMPEALDILQRVLPWYRSTLKNFQRETETFANFPTLFIGLVDKNGNFEHYDGFFRVVDSAGNIIVDKLPSHEYTRIIDEAVEPWTFMKFPFFKPMGYPHGIYRVGPLARLNVIQGFGTPIADHELLEFRGPEHKPVLSSYHYHWARLIEMIYCIERMQQLLNDSNITSKHVRAFASPNSYEGIGVTEAPRGTLIHHYKIDEQGVVTWANLIIATGHNNLAMNRGILQAAKNFVDGTKLQEGMLNRVEAVIRAFDPCLSCSTHADGRMQLAIELRSHEGELLSELRR